MTCVGVIRLAWRAWGTRSHASASGIMLRCGEREGIHHEHQLMTPVVRQRERLVDKIAVAVAGGLACSALITAWLFFARATNKSWSDALAFPAGVLVYVVGVAGLTLVDRRAHIGRYRLWLMPIAGLAIVPAAAVTFAAVSPDHPWKAALYWGLSLGVLQAWSTRRHVRSEAD